MSGWSASTWAVVALALAGVAAAAASGSSSAGTTPVVTTPVGAEESIGTWVVLGTRRGGRDLLIGDPTYIDVCHDARVDLVAFGDARVRVRLVHVATRTPAPGDVCETREVDATIEPITVKLPRRLTGQQISGPRKASLVRFRSRLHGVNGTTTHDLVGLRVIDARANLHAFGVRDRDVVVRGPRTGYVTALEPSLPSGLTKSRRVTVVTDAR